MNRAPTWVRPAANGRADHPWLAAVEQGCSTLPRDRGQHVVLSLPRDSYVVTRSRPYLDTEGSTRCCPYLASQQFPHASSSPC
jgi:hypothetical protein